jgi:hypothetical protein
MRAHRKSVEVDGHFHVIGSFARRVGVVIEAQLGAQYRHTNQCEHGKELLAGVRNHRVRDVTANDDRRLTQLFRHDAPLAVTPATIVAVCASRFVIMAASFGSEPIVFDPGGAEKGRAPD